MPRELELPDERRWDQGTPKSVLEPLLDYWYVDIFSTNTSSIYCVQCGLRGDNDDLSPQLDTFFREQALFIQRFKLPDTDDLPGSKATTGALQNHASTRHYHSIELPSQYLLPLRRRPRSRYAFTSCTSVQNTLTPYRYCYLTPGLRPSLKFSVSLTR